jgi:transcriptional regulator with XRE-family HTH domain
MQESVLLLSGETLVMDWKGERLRELRKLRGWTQKDLAEIANLDQSDVSRWERNDTRPSVESLFKLADALRVSCEAFRQAVGSKPIARRVIDDE